MLWIQYSAMGDEDFKVGLVQVVIFRIGKLVAPYPVGAFDISPDGVGLIFHNGTIDNDDDDDGSGEEFDDSGDNSSADVEPNDLPPIGEEQLNSAFPIDINEYDAVHSTSTLGPQMDAPRGHLIPRAGPMGRQPIRDNCTLCVTSKSRVHLTRKTC
jgi:hypothetical protein